MSTMYVNKVQELNVGSGVHIPGHVIQTVTMSLGTNTQGEFSALTTFLTNTITKKYANSKDRKSTRLNSSHTVISYAVFCLKKNKN